MFNCSHYMDSNGLMLNYSNYEHILQGHTKYTWTWRKILRTCKYIQNEGPWPWLELVMNNVKTIWILSIAKGMLWPLHAQFTYENL
jgi:hypothetical protein